MEELILVIPDETYISQIESFRKEFLDSGDSMDGTSSLRKFEDISQWLEHLKRNENADTCEPGWEPTTQYLCIRKSDGRLVGMVDVRHRLNEYMLNFAGHIGYSIRKSERNQGYAKAQLRLALVKCAQLSLSKVMVACGEDNEASRRTILSAGGVFENAIFDENYSDLTERYWIEL